HSVVELLQLFVNIGSRGRVPDVCIDLALRGDTDRHRFQIAVIHIRGDNAATARDLAANQFWLELLALGDVLHLLGNDALPREVHLRHVAIPICRRGARLPRCNPIIAYGHGAPSVTVLNEWWIPFSSTLILRGKFGLWHRGRGAATYARAT